MLLTTLATASRKKNPNETENSYYESEYRTKISNTLNNMNKIVVMSGTATRGSIRKNVKTFEEKEVYDYGFEFIQNTSIEQLDRLQVPSYKSRYRKFQREEKVMSKSCESIFECLKSYKDGTNIGDSRGVESSQTCASILKTDVNFDRKTKRKVQFICEENPMPLFLDGRESLAKFELSKIMKNDAKLDYPGLSERSELKNLNTINQGDMDFEGSQKTISSEDFIENVVSISELLTFSLEFPEQESK